LLKYGGSPERKGPSLWQRIMQYKSYIVLVALAIVIAATRATFAVTSIYWILIIGLVIAVIVLWLRGRNRARQYNQYNRPRSAPPQGRYPNQGPQAAPHKKHANVIPFRKKRDGKSKAKPDR
jgi:hypothetical protein